MYKDTWELLFLAAVKNVGCKSLANFPGMFIGVSPVFFYASIDNESYISAHCCS